jgi:hypothetical protein
MPGAGVERWPIMVRQCDARRDLRFRGGFSTAVLSGAAFFILRIHAPTHQSRLLAHWTAFQPLVFSGNWMFISFYCSSEFISVLARTYLSYPSCVCVALVFYTNFRQPCFSHPRPGLTSQSTSVTQLLRLVNVCVHKLP